MQTIENVAYDLEVDSNAHSLEENVAKIKEALLKPRFLTPQHNFLELAEEAGIMLFF